MEYAAGNESSLDSDNSTHNQLASNSESESAEETVSPTGRADSVGVASSRKRLPDRAVRRRERRESIHRTTSLSSQGSDTFPSKLSHPKMSLTLTGISPSGNESSQRLMRSSRRAHQRSREETVMEASESIVSISSLSRSKRGKRIKGRVDSEVVVSPPVPGESDNMSVSGEELSPTPYSPLPLALVVSIPIENSSSTPEYGSVSDVSSEVSDQQVVGQGQVGGKDMVEGEGEENSSKESNASTCEESHSESSLGESDREELDSSAVRGQFDTHSSSPGEESGTGGEGTRGTGVPQKPRGNMSENFKPSNKSGKCIPGTKKGSHGSEHERSGTNVSRKRLAKRGKKGRKGEENHMRIKHLRELDGELGEGTGGQMEKLQWESYHLLRGRDQQAIFCSPVTDEIAPGYSAVISQPMDFSQMRERIESGAYRSLEQLYQDFVLMCQNAMTYNKPATYYYKAAKKIRESGVKMLDTMARDALRSRERREVQSPRDSGSTLQGETGPLVVSIDRSLLPNFKSPKRTPPLSSPNRTAHSTPPHEIPAHPTPTTAPALNATGSGDSRETQSIVQHTVERERVDQTVPDTTLLPLPSSFTQKSSQAAATDNGAGDPVRQPTSKVVKEPAHHRGVPVSKGQTSSLEIKQKKLKRRREINKQRLYNNGTQARRIYRGSLAPIRPLNYGSFSSFAPTYDSSFANINCQETDRLSSLLERWEVRDDESLLCSGYDSEVSPYYLRLGDGILNMSREGWFDGSLAYQQRSVPPDMIRRQIMRQQAFQSEMRRRIEEPPAPSPARSYHQQLDEMLQQSALLIARLNQQQEEDANGAGPGLGEELDKISKILSAIGGNLNLDEMST